MRVAGHAYRPQKHFMSRKTISACECGEVLHYGFPLRADVARDVHAQHKAAVASGQ